MSDNDGLTVKDLAGIGSTIGQVSLSAGHVLEVNGTLDLTRNSGALQLPVGTTAQRPTTKEPGYLRSLLDEEILESYQLEGIF